MFDGILGWFKDWALQYFGALAGTIKDAVMWLIAPGIRAVFTYTGLALTTYNAVMQPLADSARAAFSGVSGDLMAWLLFFNIDKVATILISAYLLSSVNSYLRVVKRTAEAP